MPRGRSTYTTGAPTPSRKGTIQPQVRFVDKLVLNRWLLSLFGVKSFEELAKHLRDESLEGLDENNVHRFHHALIDHFPDLPALPPRVLLEYDQNIVKHTQRLNDRRITRGDRPIAWKYFQYLTLLFTEIYLDRYFANPGALLLALNTQIAAFNSDKTGADRIAPLDDQADAWPQLNKLAYWSATGSGKTLLMHINILQYRHYLDKHGRGRDLNRVILLTPNEDLSRQHLGEFEKSGISAALFDKDALRLQEVEIIDINKLREESGEKTVAVESFEGNNLVLVDEGHRGASSGDEGTWMKYRNSLCEHGFSFEYSATFGQAVKGNASLTDLYAKCILFDYSYRYFYEDGFGKDYLILNLDEETQASHQETYLVACLLAFYQQQKLFKDRESTYRPFNIEKPLWIFVGSSVTATLANRDAADIVEILRFLAHYVSDRSESIRRIDQVLNRGITTATGQNLFAGRFAYLITSGLTPAQLFEDTLATVFNAPGGGHLYVENLKGAQGEIALRLGADTEPFGVINVGDDSRLVKLCQQNGLEIGEREFSGSLFTTINDPDSTVNLLIGSRKFTEGWNSWRVSTMGLMNVGKGEGAQIIQLFGRGVRLQGYGNSLKRTSAAKLPPDVKRPEHIGILETLAIFGIHADYMAQFRDYLKDEGLSPDREPIEFLLPVIKHLGTQKLRTIRIKKTINGISTEDGDAFRELGPVPTLAKPDPSTAYLQKNQVVLNWYPKIQALKSHGILGGDLEMVQNETHLFDRHVAFMDLDHLYFELLRFKAERGWHNLNIPRSAVVDLLRDQSWYRLLIPEEQLAFDSFDKVWLWQEIALALVKTYVERYYTFRKSEWERSHLEYGDLQADDPIMLGIGKSPDDTYYRILVDKSKDEVIKKLEELKTAIQDGKLKQVDFQGLKTVWFSRHLYEPLLYLDTQIVEISPVSLNKGERQFVEDLKSFHGSAGDFFQDKQLYLLRNLSKARGVGFFEAGNFHPDFILWLVIADYQHVVFVDPKGIHNLDRGDPKLEFYQTIKDIQNRLGDPKVTLDSFIISGTPSYRAAKRLSMDKAAMIGHHILFQEEDKYTYVRDMLNAVIQPCEVAVDTRQEDPVTAPSTATTPRPVVQ